MEQNNTEKALKFLGVLSTKELEFLNRTIVTARNRKLPLAKASAIVASHDKGENMVFKDRFGGTHIGVVKKINQRYVRMFSPKEKKYFNILPTDLNVATEDDIRRFEGGGGGEKEPRVKRSYRRRNQPEIKKDERGNVIFGRRKTDAVE